MAAKFVLDAQATLEVINKLAIEVDEQTKECQSMSALFTEKSADSGLIYLRKISERLNTCTNCISSANDELIDVKKSMLIYANQVDGLSNETPGF